MRVVGFDSETFRIGPGRQNPPVVCGQWCEAVQEAPERCGNWVLGKGNVCLADEYLYNIVRWLADPQVLLVGAETAFDVLASVVTADTTERDAAAAIGLDAREPGLDLLTRWIAAYDADRVTDVIVREKLIDLGRGCYRYEKNSAGVVVGVNEYNLAAIARKRAGIDIPEDQKRCQVCDNTGCPHCPWRVRYSELHRVPVSQWPSEPVLYAETDGIATAGSWLGQWRYSERLAWNFPETQGNPAWALREEFEETRNSLWLKAMAAYGLRTDPAAVKQFEAHVRVEYEQTADFLVESGLLRRTYKRDLNAMRAYIERAGLAPCFTSPSSDGPPVWSFARACYDRGIESAGSSETAVALYLLAKGEYEHERLLELGLTEVHESKDTKAAEAAVIAAWPEAPRTGACKCANHGKGCKKDKCNCGRCCKPDKNKNGTCPAGTRKLDKDTLELAAAHVEQLAQSGLCQAEYAEVLAENLRLYGELGHLSKQLNTDIPILLRGSHEPIHTRFESILETMRTSSSGPNVQNQARGGESKCPECDGAGCGCARCKGKGKIERPGARECFVPRPGWVLIDADYSMLELHTLAQTCFWLLGHSTLGEALRAGKDPHTIVASQILGLSYAETLAALADENHAQHKAAKNARNCGKAVNFGRPGGLSARTMRSYAVKSYGVSKTEEEWKAIIDTWNQTWIEMPQYFALISRFESAPRSGHFNVSYPGLPGYRGGAHYTSACNTMYQRLGAKVAKRAGWYVFKACYVDKGSPLYGSRPVNFIHDQLLIEALEAKAHGAAIETQRLMNLAGAEMLPDVPVKTEPILARRWSKNAKEVTADGTRLRDGGVLVPWEDIRITDSE